MDPIWACGFEYNTSAEVSRSGNVVLGTTNARSGSYAIGCLTTAGWFAKDFGTNYSELCFQFSFYSILPAAETWLVLWYDGATILGGLKVATNGNIKAYAGNAATLLGTSSSPIQASQHNLVEVHIKVADAGGICDVKLNGNPVLTFSGDTEPGASANINTLVWLGVSSTTTTYYDDIVINAGSEWPNNIKIFLSPPNSDGSTKNWTCSAGSNHYALIDEVPPSATDNLSATAADVVDELGITNVPSGAYNIRAVRVDAWALKGSTNNPDQICLGLKLANGDNYSDPIVLTTAQTLVSKQFSVNPATGSEFLVSEINDAAVRMLIKSSN